MFKKIVSHLPFSPTLVGQLGFYAKRLKRTGIPSYWSNTNRTSFGSTIFCRLFAPPESANAANPTDMIQVAYGVRANDVYVRQESE